MYVSPNLPDGDRYDGPTWDELIELGIARDPARDDESEVTDGELIGDLVADMDDAWWAARGFAA